MVVRLRPETEPEHARTLPLRLRVREPRPSGGVPSWPTARVAGAIARGSCGSRIRTRPGGAIGWACRATSRPPASTGRLTPGARSTRRGASHGQSPPGALSARRDASQTSGQQRTIRRRGGQGRRRGARERFAQQPGEPVCGGRCQRRLRRTRRRGVPCARRRASTFARSGAAGRLSTRRRPVQRPGRSSPPGAAGAPGPYAAATR